MPNGHGYTITYDGVSSDTLGYFICHRVSRGLVGKSRSQIKEIAGYLGAWIFPDEPGLRKINVDASVLVPVFPVARREILSAVATWLDKPGLKELRISDEEDRYYLATVVNEMETEEWRERGKFSIEFLALPYAYSDTISTLDFLVIPGTPHTWLFYDQVSAYPIIEVTPRGGTLTNFFLEVNGLLLSNTSTIPENATWTISSLSFTSINGVNTDLDLTGTFTPSSIAMIGVSGDFPILLAQSAAQSLRIVSYGSTATSVDIHISWRERFR